MIIQQLESFIFDIVRYQWMNYKLYIDLTLRRYRKLVEKQLS